MKVVLALVVCALISTSAAASSAKEVDARLSILEKKVQKLGGGEWDMLRDIFDATRTPTIPCSDVCPNIELTCKKPTTYKQGECTCNKCERNIPMGVDPSPEPGLEPKPEYITP